MFALFMFAINTERSLAYNILFPSSSYTSRLCKGLGDFRFPADAQDPFRVALKAMNGIGDTQCNLLNPFKLKRSGLIFSKSRIRRRVASYCRIRFFSSACLSALSGADIADEADASHSAASEIESLRARVIELEALVEQNQGLCEVLDDEEGPDVTFATAVQRRAKWLIGLLVAQSLSSSVLESNEELLRTSPVIIFFLTMLVGAGGNAGNQAAVRIVRGLATGAVGRGNGSELAAVRREALMAAVLASVMLFAGAARTVAAGATPAEVLAVSLSLSIIVAVAVFAGATIPLALNRVGVDAAHATTIVQVVASMRMPTIPAHARRNPLSTHC